MTATRPGLWNRMAPALLLAFLAPAMTELLPGATRFSSLFVFPIEMAVWGGGAVLIRALVRRRGLGWWSLLLLGLALAVAEECLIQQTSLAPLVIRLKGETWARAFGVNYVYLLWALVYEAVWVVMLPVLLAELVFPGRRGGTWLSRAGAIVAALLFLGGALLAWFSWTHVARVQVFHQPLYVPPLPATIAAIVAMAALVAAALAGPRTTASAPPPSPALTGLGAGFWAILWYGLVVLAFGIAPRVPPLAPLASGIALTALLLLLVPRWASHPRWSGAHDYALVAGALTGSMAVSFAGFIGADPKDRWFKVATDLAALALLLWFGRTLSRRR